MTRSRPFAPSDLAALGLILGVLVLSCYRAASQSITHDEASAYLAYGAGPWSHLFERFRPDNHVLYTVLSRISVAVFGLSELTVRLPTLAAAAFILIMLHRITRRYWFACSGVTGDGVNSDGGREAHRLLALAFVVLNPLFLDYFVAARGYAVALALALLAVARLLGVLEAPRDERNRRHLLSAALAASLAITAHLTFGLFMAVVSAVFVLILLGDSYHEAGQAAVKASIRRVVAWYVVPAGLVTSAILVPFLRQMQKGELVEGESTLRGAVNDMATRSLHHHVISVPWRTDTGTFDAVLALVVDTMVPGIALLLAVAAIVVGWRWVRGQTFSAMAPIERFLFFWALVFFVCLGALIVMHEVLDLPYPKARFALYFAVTFSFGVSALPGWLWHRRWRLSSVLLSLLMGACVVQFLVQAPVQHFSNALHDAHSRSTFQWLESRRRPAGEPALRVASYPYIYGAAIDFYALAEGANWIEPVDIQPHPDRTYDYVLLHPLVKKRLLAAGKAEILHDDPFTGLSIAVFKK
ncbi:MAG: hypothetical protein AB1486_05040 [Planctomycetota bacterium]